MQGAERPVVNEIKEAPVVLLKRPDVQIKELADNLRLAKLCLEAIEDIDVRHIKTVRYSLGSPGRPVRLTLPNGTALEFLSQDPESVAIKPFNMSPGVLA